MNIELASSFERGASNEKFKKQGGTLIYTTWKDGMNPIKYYSDLIGNRKVWVLYWSLWQKMIVLDSLYILDFL